MIVEELKKACQEQIDLYEGSGLIGPPEIAVMQSGRWGKTDYRKLLGVKGEIV